MEGAHEFMPGIQPSSLTRRSYMIIMQTLDAAKQRKSIESKGQAKVIWGYEHDDTTCVQYHPKGIKGLTSGPFQSHKPHNNIKVQGASCPNWTPTHQPPATPHP